MMKAISRILNAVCIAALLTVSFVGCGSKSAATPDNTNPPEKSTVQQNETPKQVTMRFSWWGGDARHKATLDAIKAYETKNANVKIEGEYMGAVNDYRQKLFTQFAGNSAPDIIQIDAPWLPEIYKMGEVLTDLYQYKDKLDTSGFDQKFLESYCIKDSKLYSLPTGINSLIMTLNKAILDKAGVKADQDWTWDTLLSDGKKINQADSKNYFLNTDQVALSTVLLKTYIIQKTGEQFIKDDYTLGFDKATLVDALEYMNKLFAEKVIQPAADSFQYPNKYEQNPIWVNMQAATIVTWNSTIMMWSQQFINTAEVSNIPIFADAKNTGVMVRPAHVLSINASSASKEEAAKFMNYFYNDEEAIKILKDSRSVQPTENGRKICLDNNLTNPLVIKAAEIAQGKQGLIYNALSNNQELIDMFTNTIEEVALGKVPTDQAADKLIKSYNTKLAELKAAAK